MGNSYDLELVARSGQHNDGWAVFVPEKATVRLRRSEAHDVTADVDTGAGGVVITRLSVEGSVEHPVTSAALRSFQVKPLERAIRIFLNQGEPFRSTHVDLLSRSDIERSRTGAPRDQFFQRVELLKPLTPGATDQAYLDDLKAGGPRSLGAVATIKALFAYANSNGLSPHPFVCEVLAMPKATASRWITAAREVYPDLDKTLVDGSIDWIVLGQGAPDDEA